MERERRHGPTRRRYLRATALSVSGALWVIAAATPASAADVEYRSGSTERCARFVRYKDDDEEFYFCTGPSGTVREVTDDDGDETREVYDENGVLRLFEEEEADGDERREVYDENGVLRLRERKDDDGDERREEFDENGVLRRRERKDDDGDKVVRIYDENGQLLEVRRDD
ncbi:hypothetical protein [Halogeometricum limi]|uniref:MORN repeat variant n=1 Tax=Halogeometricum limi TaxID=555875 RepID=A0A1I6IJD3_9EURY|nr:hypothetical protein [Halogeometricum limi]SFR66813.1 MORN repeat variant [Halogeometricum limi]